MSPYRFLPFLYMSLCNSKLFSNHSNWLCLFNSATSGGNFSMISLFNSIWFNKTLSKMKNKCHNSCIQAYSKGHGWCSCRRKGRSLVAVSLVTNLKMNLTCCFMTVICDCFEMQKAQYSGSRDNISWMNHRLLASAANPTNLHLPLLYEALSYFVELQSPRACVLQRCVPGSKYPNQMVKLPPQKEVKL